MEGQAGKIRIRPAILLLSAAMVLAVTLRYADSPAEPYNARLCIVCHQETYDLAVARRIVHIPFLEKKCPACHLADKPEEVVFPRDIRWLAKDYEATDSHWFILSGRDVKQDLFIRAETGTGETAKLRLTAPPVPSLPQIQSDTEPPRIDQVGILAVERGLYLTATVGWRTDEPSDSQVYYGEGKLNLRTTLKSQYTRQHSVTLDSLRAGREYRFSVLSRDLSGNLAEAGPFELDLDNAGKRPPQADESPGTDASAPRLESRLSARGDDYVLAVTADRPVTMEVGTHMHRSAATPAGRDVQSLPGSHVTLKNRYDTNNTVCDTCHLDFRDSFSHPVNVRPPRGMTIPPEYPTLPGGRITCMSCHAVHGSDYHFRLLKPSKRELCIGCHKDFS